MDAASDKIGVTVPDDALLSDSARIIRQGLAALGHGQSFTLPRNAPTCKGAGRCCFGCPNGAKLSTDRSYLPEAVEAGVTLLWDTRASQIRELDDGVEVLVHGHGGRQLLRADKLVLAAGALGTPHLIRSNGLGGRHREAGHGLRMHPATKVFGMMPDALKHGGIPQGLGYRTERLPRVTFEGVHTPPGAAAPVLSVAGSRHLAWMNAYDRLATYGLMVRDRATGTVQGMGQAKVLDYALDPEDAQDLGAGVLMVAEALFLAGAERVLLPLVGVDPEVGSMDALQRWSSDDFTPDKLTTVGFHPQGTAGMGRIVDRDCKLIGSERIWVGDASVMPDSPGVNPQVTIMGLALRLADHLQHEV
jgi:choline dehydrogenase-like flavoprotein